MSRLKTIFMVSLLAIFLSPRETDAQATISENWSKLGKCTQVAIETITSLTNKIVPTFYELKKCSGYVVLEQPNGKGRKITWYLKVTFEFFKKLAFDKPECLHNLISQIAQRVKPYTEQITLLGCLDENDFII
ncbi:accessory gland protein Acp53Ea [Drosophila suzukii]|uniref:Accessory gland protein Acp53Ea n=1 Tax=Drosophila suzukii TaxID=28584 RepID=A0AB39Z455_DROSZ